MNQEKFVNSYVELLNATLTEALQKNLVLQVQKTLAEKEISDAEQKVRNIEIKIKELTSQKDQEIGNLKGQLNEERKQIAIVSNEREEIRKTTQHVDTFKMELVKARAEINQLKDELKSKDLIVTETLNRLSLMEQEKNSVKSKKAPLEKTKPTKELIKDAGSF
jgi:predicted RNase H-like nuclease (RuvC/YqgF family)